MATLIICELITLQFAMHTLTATRAFVGGEGLWSKSQKNALISLQNYGITKKDSDYFLFLDDLKVPEGDHIARVEMEKPKPDYAIIKKGFLQGQVHPEDIKPMVDLINRFHNVSYLARAIKVWKQADDILTDFKLAASQYHNAVFNGDTVRANRTLNKITAINEKLSAIEDEFSYQLGAASRWVEYIVLALLCVAVLIVESIGLTLTIFTIRSISRGLRLLKKSATLIGQGQFSESLNLQLGSNDEIGQLASSINRMGKILQLAYSDLERRVSERTLELAQSKDQLEVILKGISDGITVIDRTGKFVFANIAGAKMCGYSTVAEMLDAKQSEILEQFEMRDENDQPFPMERLPSQLAFNGATDIPPVILRLRFKKTGEDKWSMVTSTPIYGPKQVNLVVTIFKDFTERKAQEESVKFLDAANKILSSSLDYEVTLKNLATLVVPKLADWCSISLAADDKKPPRNVAIAHSDPSKLEWAQEFVRKYPPDWNSDRGQAKVLRTGQSELYPSIGEERLIQSAKDPQHLRAMLKLGLKSVMIVPLVSRGKTLAIMTLVTTESDRQYTQQDLLFAEELARRASIAIDNAMLYRNIQKAVTARDEFLSIASHELKTPLTSLSLQIQMTRESIDPIQGKAPSPEKLADIFEVSDKQVNRLTRLVEDLLDISRIQSGNLQFEFEKTNLSNLVKDMTERFVTPLTNAKCVLDVKIQENVEGYVDAGRIEQVIENLLTNAIKYAPGMPVLISLSSSGNIAQLIVKDFGPGIEPGMQSKIFQRFERANSSKAVTGLGLGLYIVKEIVKAHHGEVHLSSKPGAGTKFTIEIPLYGQKSSFVNISEKSDNGAYGI